MKPHCRRWKGEGKRVWALEKHEGHVRKEEGGRVPLLPYPSRAGLAPKFPSLPFPFEHLPRRLEIIKLFFMPHARYPNH